MRSFLPIALLACAAAGARAQYPNLCPDQSSFSAWNQTRCPEGWSCAPNGFSVTGWGCAPFPNAVSCGAYQACPGGTTCQSISGSSYSQVFKCVGAPGGDTISICPCKSGVPLPMDPVKKNVVIIGDSLTIGYTPVVASLLEDIALVQHVPWDFRDGGAEETAYGLQCVDNWLASPSGLPITPDLIYFNFGIHDIVTQCQPGYGCVPGQSGNTTVYPGELTAITKKILAFAGSIPKKATVVFGITTAFLCSNATDAIVTSLNSEAKAIMQSFGVPMVDLHTAIINKCGPAPISDCLGVQNCFCPHCPGAGYEFLASTTIAPALRALLTA